MFFLWGGCPLAVTCSSHSSLFRAVCYLFSNSPASHERLAPVSQISSFLKGGLLLALKFSSVFRAVCSLCSVRLGEGFSWSWIHGEVEQNACAGEKEVSDPVHIGGEAIRPCAGRRVCFGLCPCMLMLEKLFRACPGQRNSLSDSSQKTPYGDKKKTSPTFGGGGGGNWKLAQLATLIIPHLSVRAGLVSQARLPVKPHIRNHRMPIGVPAHGEVAKPLPSTQRLATCLPSKASWRCGAAKVVVSAANTSSSGAGAVTSSNRSLGATG